VNPPVSDRTANLRRHGLVAALVLAYVFSFLDRQVISLLVEPLKRQMALTDTDISLLQGLAFALFLAIAGLPIGRWIDTGRRTTIIAIGIAVWSVMTAASGLASSFGTLIVLRMGVAIGEATLTPAAHSLIADTFAGEKLGFAMGLYGTGSFLGLGVAYLGGAAVLAALPHDGQVALWGLTFHSWQVVFLAIGLPGIAVAILMALLREPPRMSGAAVMAMGDVTRFFRRHAAAIMLFNLNVAFAAMMSYALAAWIPSVFVRSFGWTAARAGSAFGLVVVFAGVLGVVLGGWLGDRVSRKLVDGRLVVMAWTALAAAPFAVTAMLAATPGLMLALLVPAILLCTMSIGLGPSVSQAMMPSAVRGMASAIAVTIVNLVGLGLGPTIVALLTDHLFHDPRMVRYALAIAMPVMLGLATMMGLLARGPYRRALREIRG
jgi:MFS family permease